ncbi:MAG: phosphotransferase, partial [Armatimonadetes bacterium]|nr:phosphotransferase [Armatimonadota bacterium]
RVEAGGQSWFVRRRGPRTSTPERVAFDHGLRRHLADHGFPTAAPLTAVTGDAVVRLEDGLYEAYPWVSGQGLTPGIAAAARGPAAAALARFHTLAATYRGECEPLVPQFGHYPSPIRPRPRFDDPGAFLEALAQIAERYTTPANRDALRRARDWVVWWDETYSALYQRLPRGVIHGDYNGCNLLFHPDGQVAGVFDYDWAWRETRVRDIGEGLFFFGAQRETVLDGGSIWSLTSCPRLEGAGMAEFLGTYHRAAPLSADELRAVPLAMLGRWIACRTEGAMKVPEERRAEFALADFERPFTWYQRAASALQEAVSGSA